MGGLLELYKADQAVAEKRIWVVDPDGTQHLVDAASFINEPVFGAPAQASGFATIDLEILDFDLARQEVMEEAVLGSSKIVFFDSRWQSDPSASGIYGVDLEPYETASAGSFVQGAGGTNEIADGDSITVGTKTYTWRATITGASVDGDVLLGVDDEETLQNMFDAINLTGTPGTQYASAMTANADLYASGVSATSLDVAAKFIGPAGDGLALTASIVSTNYAWGAATTAGGTGIATSDIVTAIAALEMFSTTNPDLATPIVREFAMAGNDPLVEFTAMIPGISSNDIDATTSDGALLAWSAVKTSGGANSATTGLAGTIRIGTFDNGSPLFGIFFAVEDDVWYNLTTSAFTWAIY